MDLLLDTHALLWAMEGNPRVPKATRTAITNPANRVYVSAASAWEIAIKVGTGKLTLPSDAATWLPTQMGAYRFEPLPITIRHALEVERLPRHHADPFDRILIAQAMVEQLTIVTADPQFERYPAQVLRC